MKNREKAVKRNLREKKEKREKREMQSVILEVKKTNNQEPNEIVGLLERKKFF